MRVYHYRLLDGRLLASTNDLRQLPRRMRLKEPYVGMRDLSEHELLNAPPLEDRRREAMSEKITILALTGEHSHDDLMNDIAAQYATYKANVTGDDRIVKASVDTLKHYATITVERDMMAKLNEMYETYVMFNGERPAEGYSDWDSGLDDEVEKLVEPYVSVLSADWLGRNTVDARLHEEGQAKRLAASLAAEAWKGAVGPRTGPQIMSGAGVLTAQVQEAVGGVSGASATAAAPRVLSGVVEALTAILAHAGEAFDPISTYDELDSASDDDDGLSFSAMSRLVPEADESAWRYYVQQLRAYRVSTSNAVDTMLDMLSALSSDPNAYAEAIAAEAAAPAVTSDVPLPGERKKRTKKEEKAEAAAAAVEGALDPRVIAALKAHANVKDDDIAKGIGTSRATVNNIVNGKTAFSPNADQTAFLRNLIWEHMDGLREAMSLIDGVEYALVVSEG